MERKEMIGVYAACQVKADKVAEFEQLVQKFVNESRTHSGCVSYDCGKVSGCENGYVFLEKWASKADLDAHLACAFFTDNAPALVSFTENGLDIQTAELL
ncbi:putative quinol monooxygenase [Kingella negevensis]|uniref:putative quinol monooxygenase n=1 Tax=Kingella negevensis TaxID=1522312 RepID=UPI001FD83EFD|nr:putative quinol monooxygenase [Kingella negevensis]MDK4689203.1 putative quinol monooxygenase [Kingella negevensis]WII91442.1 putative quinol monooxygenase [Kingella negevensis]